LKKGASEASANVFNAVDIKNTELKRPISEKINKKNQTAKPDFFLF